MTGERMAGYSRRSVMNIYIGNLGLGVTEDELRQFFQKYGQVDAVTIMSDMYIGSRQPRCYAYIEMLRPEGELAVAALDGKIIGDRTVNVVEALPLSPGHETVCAHHKFRSR
jgi:RNA recognition motif-containing protein